MVAARTRVVTGRLAVVPSRRTRPSSSTLKELGLERGRHLGDLVEEQAAAVGDLEEPLAAGHGARVSPFFDAEELGLDKTFRERGAVDGEEGAAGARAGIVDGAGEQALARAGFAGDQHRRARRREPLRQRLHLLPGRRGPHQDGALAFLGPAPALHQLDAFELVDAQGAAHGQPQLFKVDRFRQVVVDAVAQGVHGVVEAGKSRNQDHLGLVVGAQQIRHQGAPRWMPSAP